MRNKEYWLARDQNGKLFMYAQEPKRLRTCFCPRYIYTEFWGMPDDMMKELTFENSPVKLGVL